MRIARGPAGLLCAGGVFGAIALLAAACRPAARVGVACHVENQWVCVAGNRALVCEAGAWAEIPCKGSGGCRRRGTVDDCDDTVAQEGDRCPPQPPVDYACSADGAQALACHGGRFEVWRHCRGAKGCSVAADRHLDCDTTLGQPADPCSREGTYACTLDTRAMLRCDGRGLRVASSCRGPDGCRFDRENHKVDCDDRLAVEGDACETPNRITCELGRKVELVCDPGADRKYVKKRECRQADCRVEDNELFCE